MSLPADGVLEFDFVSCFLMGRCRRAFNPSRYLPSNFQMKQLLALAPAAPAAGERNSKTFRELRALVRPYLLTVEQWCTGLATASPSSLSLTNACNNKQAKHVFFETCVCGCKPRCYQILCVVEPSALVEALVVRP